MSEQTKAELVVNLYDNDLSIRDIRRRIRIGYNKTVEFLKAAGRQTDKRERGKDLFEFCGKLYKLRSDGYYRATKRDASGKKTFLHRDIFEHYHGRKIKPGWHVDHDDQNNRNNSIENLVEREPSEHSIKGAKYWRAKAYAEQSSYRGNS